MYLTTRNESKALHAKETLIKDPAIDANNVQWLILDLFDPVSVTAAAEELKRRETKVDLLSIFQALTLRIDMTTNKLLVNNAAASTSSRELVDGKYEQHMAAK